MERLELEGRSRRKRRRRRRSRGHSLEVKENQDEDVLRKFHPSAFCTSFPRRAPRCLKRKLVDGKDRLLYRSHPAGKRFSWAVTQKNALVQLNELRPGLRYEITSRTGPLHAPLFSVGVEVNGVHFEGRGPTKKQAKLRAAELALQSFIQFPNASQAQASMGSFTSTDKLDFTGHKLDFTGDKLDFTADKLDFTGDKLDFTGDKLDFTGDKLDFTGHKLDFTAGKLDFTADKLDFTGDKLDFTADKLDFTGDKLDFTGHKLDFTADKLDFTGDKLDFTTDKLDFTGDKLDFTGDKLDFTADKLDFTANKLDFTADKLDFTADKLDFTADKLDFTADKLDFTADKLDFTADKLDFTADKLDFTADKLDFTADKLDFTADKLDFTADKLDFTRDKLGFTADKLDFTADKLDFTADKLDFTADKLDFEPSLLENCDLLQCSTARQQVFSSIYSHTRLVRLTLDLFSSATPKRRAVSASLFHQLSPVALLGQLRPGLRYMCLTERLHGRPVRSFVMVLRLEGRVFEGCSHSKRLAKAQAAAAALQDLYSISLGPERKLAGPQASRTKNQLPQFFSESIFHLVREKFRELSNGRFSTSSSPHKVLAGIVMTRGFDLRSASVVSLATGTKCVDCGRQEDDGGWTLSDCHAETISRRALVGFLYSQLELLLRKPADGQESSIFVPNRSCSGVFRLQDGVLFHMFVSSSPCGDARLNCPYETIGAYPSRKFRCHLRMKVNGGEGTLPVSANQRWDGLSPGKCLVSMSCTDKMAKWSVVGLQGSLLSHLVEPVYLHSLTVGTLSHTGHLARAMRRRLATVKHLPSPYRRRTLLLGCLSSREVRPAGKPSGVSLNWSCGDGGLEEISSSTGRRTDSGTPSRLCSRSVFIRWLKLQQQLNGSLPGVTLASYCASKASAGRYQRAMQQFSSALQGGGLGTWLRKPPMLHNIS
uniref:Adenosine deaminase RNA specific B2 (inactive) n=1 Tax=Amphiprion ocellaris TaxID=80972 RepID=A0AAQ6AJC0_AMPOC